MMQQVIWLVGDYRQPDFAEPLGWLQSRAECHLFASPRYPLVAAAIGRPKPAAVVLLEARPGDIAKTDIEKLRPVAPLATFVVLAGPWCEGEQRRSRRLPGVVCVPWRAWRWRLARELGWQPDRPAGDRQPLRALVRTGRRELYESLAAGLRHLGASGFWEEIASDGQKAVADVLVCDGWEHAGDCHVQVPRLLLLHFPRPADERRAGEQGIAAIVALPFVLADLAAALDAVRGERT
jgi:hypothetical protein